MDHDEQLHAWIEAYADRLTYLAYTYVRDQKIAEDITQEAFLKAYRAMEQLERPDNPLPWLMRIVINECYSATRRKRWREVVTTVFPVQSTKSAEDIYLQETGHQEIHQAVLALPETYRTPIILFYFENLPIQQIAQALNLRPGAVRTRLARGRERLEKHLKRGEEDEFGGTPSGYQATLHSRG